MVSFHGCADKSTVNISEFRQSSFHQCMSFVFGGAFFRIEFFKKYYNLRMPYLQGIVCLLLVCSVYRNQTEINKQNTNMFNRSRKKITAFIFPTIDLWLFLVFCIKFLKLSSILISWIIWSLVLFSQIISIAFDVRGQLVTYFPILLDYGLLPLGTSGVPCVLALDISKVFDRVWHASLLFKLPYLGFLLPCV